MSEDYSRNEKEKWMSAVESITIVTASHYNNIVIAS